MTDQYVQDPTAKLDYTRDWTAELAANNNATISTATVTATGGATISQSSHTTTTVTYRVVTAAVTGTPCWIYVTTHVVLSTGEEDDDTIAIQVTDT